MIVVCNGHVKLAMLFRMCSNVSCSESSVVQCDFGASVAAYVLGFYVQSGTQGTPFSLDC